MNVNLPSCNDVSCNGLAVQSTARRRWLTGALGMGALQLTGLSLLGSRAEAASWSRGQRDAYTPDEVVQLLKDGNQRFREGSMRSHDFHAQRLATADGQYPAAAILSCIDSRVPAEIVFDAAIGDVFNGRVAGNVATPELIGSLEFTCALAGSKLVLVLGHTGCGAVAGAISGAKLGHLTGLLEQITPAIAATEYQGAREASNRAYVDAVASTHVRQTVELIRQRSPELAKLEQDGKIRMMGAMYHLGTGEVIFI